MRGAEALDLVARFQKAGPGGVDAALEQTRDAWRKTRAAMQVSSPAAGMDPLVNGWLPRQALKSRMDARSGYHQASGAFGGRDQVQDSLIGLHLDPLITRNQIRLVARRQFREGDIQHWWFQFRGEESGFGVRTKFSDDLLWMPYALAQYLELEPLERQALLERDGVLARCRGLIELLEMNTLVPRVAWKERSVH